MLLSFRWWFWISAHQRFYGAWQVKTCASQSLYEMDYFRIWNMKALNKFWCSISYATDGYFQKVLWLSSITRSLSLKGLSNQTSCLCSIAHIESMCFWNAVINTSEVKDWILQNVNSGIYYMAIDLTITCLTAE